MGRYKEVLPMCEQVMRLGIGFPGLLALDTAVVNKAARDKLPREAAAYRVMEDIENYNNGTLQRSKQYARVQLCFAVEVVVAPRKDLDGTKHAGEVDGGTNHFSDGPSEFKGKDSELHQ